MKCSHCGSEWNSSTTVNECPFCKKPLKIFTGEPKTLKSVLVQIREQAGLQTFANGKALVSCFKDLAPEMEKEYMLLWNLERCDGIKDLYQVKDQTDQDQNSAVTKVVDKMTDKLSISQSAAQMVCGTYMQVLTGRENDVQAEPNSPEELGDLRAQLIKKLKDNIPTQTDAAAKANQPPVAIPGKSEAQSKTSSKVPVFEIDSKGTLVKYNGTAETVVIPSHVRTIGAKVFERNQRITRVHLPDGLIAIEENAFAGCQNLQRIVFPQTLLSIGSKAFWACHALQEITLPGSANQLLPLAFWGCKGLKKVILQEGITKLGDDVFNYCSGLLEIHLPKTLKTVHLNAFAGAMNARVYGNLLWTVKDGHVVPKAQSTHNEGANQRTTAGGQAAKKPPQQTAPEQPAQPKAATVPPKPSATAPKAQASASAGSGEKKKQKKKSTLLTNMWLWIILSLVFFGIAFRETGYDRALYVVVPMSAVAYWMGRQLVKLGHKILGGFILFNAAVFITIIYTAMPVELWLSVTLQILMIIMLVYSGIKYGE